MKKYIDSFSLLLGRVPDFDVEGIVDSDERWRGEVITLPKLRLGRAGGQLGARPPAGA
jgi:hypothetical protein